MSWDALAAVSLVASVMIAKAMAVASVRAFLDARDYPDHLLSATGLARKERSRRSIWYPMFLRIERAAYAKKYGRR